MTDLCIYASVLRPDEELNATIWYKVTHYTAGYPACYYQKNGDPGWPAESAEYEFAITDIELDGGEITADERLTLTAWFEDNHERACERADEEAESTEMDRGDFEYDRWKDDKMERNRT